MKRAFTLIELLVVIAIIAILAAILFPVFAQAKAAAKKTASISNVKQKTLGVLLYAGDVDDTMVPATLWAPQNSPGGNGYPFGFGNGWAAPWTWLILPYIKNGDIFQDPQAQGPAKGFASDLSNKIFYPSYGLNYVWLSPWDGTKQTPVSLSALARPADTVMIASKWSSPETDLGDGFLGFNFSYAAQDPLLNYTVETPHCYTIPQYCAANWGVDSWETAKTVAAGRNTGGNSLRAGNQTVVGWTDGHAKAMAPGRLAVGTNWTPTIPKDNTVYVTGWEESNLWGAR